MITHFPELKTERLQLIQITQSHLEDYYQLFSDERVARYYNILPFSEQKDAQKYIDWFESRFNEGLGIRWGIALKGEKNIIGTLGFNNYKENHRANIGYDLRFDFWNKGLMTEALRAVIAFGFNELGINRMEAEVMMGNAASERVLGKLGFKREGALREWMYWNDRYYDMIMFSLLKYEYTTMQGAK